MIKKLTVKNFYSIKKENVINFSDSDVFLVFGHNASGKTNLLKAIAFLKWFIGHSFISQEPDEPIPFDTYAFTSLKNKPAFLQVEFSHKKVTYKYALELTDSLVTFEKLWVQNKRKRKTFSRIFSRKWNSNTHDYDLVLKNFSLSISTAKKLLRKNCSLLAVAKQVELSDAEPIHDFWSHVWTNISQTGKIRNDTIGDIINISNIYQKNPELFLKVLNLIQKLDLGISGIELVKKDNDGEKKDDYFPIIIHSRKDDNIKHKLPIVYESSGSKNLYVMLFYIIRALESGGVVLLDEVDGELHPLLVSDILDLFINKRINKKNAQIFLSTHNADLMNKVKKEQVVLVEKNENLESDAYLLSDVEGVRSNENFMAKYLAGAYGAIKRE